MFNAIVLQQTNLQASEGLLWSTHPMILEVLSRAPSGGVMQTPMHFPFS